MRILWAGLLVGFVLNLLGWLGNVFLLGPMWQEAFTGLATSAWRDSPWRDVISLVPDFIYGIAICWLYAALAVRYGASVVTALRACALVFVVGAFTTYLGIANSGLLPWGLAAATTLLALVVFVTGAWLVDRLMRGHVGARR
jgi:hypothetical protein